MLGLLFGQPDRVFTLKELIDLAHSGTGAVQREVDRLGASGIVTVTSTPDRRKRVQANPSSPIFDELHRLVEKTTGVAAELRRVIEKMGNRVELAILFGSVAKGTDSASSDIDVLLVSDQLTQEEVFVALAAAERRLGRRINPTIYTSEEFTKRRRSKNPFLTKVLAGKYVLLAGSEDDVTA